MVQRGKMTERNVIGVSGVHEENKGEDKKISQTKVTKGHKSN